MYLNDIFQNRYINRKRGVNFEICPIKRVCFFYVECHILSFHCLLKCGKKGVGNYIVFEENNLTRFQLVANF